MGHFGSREGGIVHSLSPSEGGLAGRAHSRMLCLFPWVCEQEGLFEVSRGPPQRRAPRGTFSPRLTPPHRYQAPWGPFFTASFL